MTTTAKKPAKGKTAKTAAQIAETLAKLAKKPAKDSAPAKAKKPAAPPADAPTVDEIEAALDQAVATSDGEPASDVIVDPADVEATPAPQPDLTPFELTPVPVVDDGVKGQLVTAKTICLVVKKSKFGNSRRASTEAVTVEADKKLLSLTKCILDSPELVAIQRLDYEVRDWLKTLCLKSMFKGGVYLLPIGLVNEVDAKLHEFAGRRAQLVEAAVAAYPQRMQETSERLGVLENSGDYPSAAMFQAKFGFEWSYVTFDTPTRLKAINAAIFAAEQEKAQAKLTAVAAECESAMRAGLLDLIDKMVERLQPGEDGKPKKFHASLVENMNEFLRTFELRNVTDDAKMAQVVAKARAVLNGVDPKTLRKDEALRNAVAGQFEALKGVVEQMVIERGTREISFEDEE